ncbi:hypothetical protein GPECTOR_1g20 [Gonium pectorale]|uniref:Bifunctional inhibitor/plant lipid transfer protein/seed storage helical domain-containing protein n=1 Tax=Gonium pectorale TaxID=33097 RepID=A0A150H3U1_GONPE|nr:hypothetical protein GPECTOR_1g20 [Gonium pectorale]|eukprot:KXZ56230.1 hypothetical protein GPECTOR_1g20 [Gonium pectorale]
MPRRRVPAPRRPATLGARAAAALVLVLVIALSSPHVSGKSGNAAGGVAGYVDEADCVVAYRKRDCPYVAEFKHCAIQSPIPARCCLKLAPLVPYTACLQIPKYWALADGVLAPNVTVDRVLQDCVGLAGG